jgi:hypothetical protein
MVTVHFMCSSFDLRDEEKFGSYGSNQELFISRYAANVLGAPLKGSSSERKRATLVALP